MNKPHIRLHVLPVPGGHPPLYHAVVTRGRRGPRTLQSYQHQRVADLFTSLAKSVAFKS